MERQLRGLGLSREKAQRVTTPEGLLSLTEFRLPENGTACFRRIDTGCWCAGVPSTGTLRALLRAAGLFGKTGLQFPGETTPLATKGFLAVDAGVVRAGHFRKIRLWWIDGQQPRAFRLAGRFRSELFLNLKPC